MSWAPLNSDRSLVFSVMEARAFANITLDNQPPGRTSTLRHWAAKRYSFHASVWLNAWTSPTSLTEPSSVGSSATLAPATCEERSEWEVLLSTLERC